VLATPRKIAPNSSRMAPTPPSYKGLQISLFNCEAWANCFMLILTAFAACLRHSTQHRTLRDLPACVDVNVALILTDEFAPRPQAERFDAA
jgi:hypothetical protein